MTVLALICALAAPCEPATARVVIPLGQAVIFAGLWQQDLARLAVQPGPGEHWRVVCEAEHG